MLALPLASMANLGEELNKVDKNGMRQGYWIVKGYMSDEDGFPANATVEEGNYVNNSKEGVWKRYFANGELRSEITYENDSPYGAYSIYYDNGQLQEKSTWHRNKNVGEFKRFYENGEPQQDFFFSDSGKRNGVQRYFHENGQLELEVNIVNGKEEGKMTRYFENGKVKETKILNGGTLKKGTIRKYGGNAPKKVTTPPAEKQEKEMITEVQKDDKPNEAFRFEPNGHNILYNAAQQITQIGDFKNGRLWNGKWYRYNANGILIKIEIYKDGNYVGTGVIEEDD